MDFGRKKYIHRKYWTSMNDRKKNVNGDYIL